MTLYVVGHEAWIRLDGAMLTVRWRPWLVALSLGSRFHRDRLYTVFRLNFNVSISTFRVWMWQAGFECPAIPASSCPIFARRQSESINNDSLGFAFSPFPPFISVTSRGSTRIEKLMLRSRVPRNCAREYVERPLHNAEDVWMIPHAADDD